MPKWDGEDKITFTPGWRLLTLTGNDTNDEGDFVLEFTIQGPDFKGLKYVQKLADPCNLRNDKDVETAFRRMCMWGKRMGLLTDKDKGTSPVIDFGKAMGFQGAMEWHNTSFPDKDNPGRTVSMCLPTFSGIYPLTHESIPPAARLHMGLALLPGQAMPVAGEQSPAKERKVRGKAKDEPAAAKPPEDLSDFNNV
jgi:hypothetical protein